MPSKIRQKLRYPMTTVYLNPVEKLVYLLLEGEWKLNQREPFSITVKEIAGILSVSERTVDSVMSRLRKHNVISSIQVNRGATNSYSRYTLITYLTTDSDSIPNYMDDGGMLLTQDEVGELFGSCDINSPISEKDIPF